MTVYNNFDDAYQVQNQVAAGQQIFNFDSLSSSSSSPESSFGGMDMSGVGMEMGISLDSGMSLLSFYRRFVTHSFGF